MNGFLGTFAYLGPETMLPLTSVAAGLAGILLMLGRTSIRWCLNLIRSTIQRVLTTFRGLTGSRRPKVARIQDLNTVKGSVNSKLVEV